jgi:hypothetical protein
VALLGDVRVHPTGPGPGAGVRVLIRGGRQRLTARLAGLDSADICGPTPPRRWFDAVRPAAPGRMARRDGPHQVRLRIGRTASDG